jgi:hypothetical protein
MCNADFRLITENRRGYVDLNGIKGWVKRLEYTPDKTAVLQLLTAEIPCCAQEECCTYRVEGAYPLGFACLTFNKALYENDDADSLSFAIASGGSGSDFIAIGFIATSFPYTSDQLISSVAATFDDNDGKYRMVVSDTSICIYWNFDLEGDVVIASVSANGGLLQTSVCDGFTVDGTFIQQNGSLPIYECDNNIAGLTGSANTIRQGSFQVLLNGSWTTIDPEQIVDGVWERTTCDQITSARIIDPEENVIETLNVECL